jgi:hypothetical protein
MAFVTGAALLANMIINVDVRMPRHRHMERFAQGIAGQKDT